MRLVWKWLRRGLLGLAALISVFLLVLLAMFGYLQIESRQTVTLPAPTGPYQVGRTIYEWTDQARPDPFSPQGQSPRELSVWAWYPARSPRGARHAAYLPSVWQRAFQGDDFMHTRADAVTTHSWEDVPVANAEDPFSVLVFMPGFGRVAADYTTLAEDLASQGYVVFAINPTYLSDEVVLGHGRVVPANAQVAETIDNARAREPVGARVTEVEAADLRFTLDQAQVLDRASGGRFAGRLDTSRIGFFGHSIGGSSATRACELDPRCMGAVNLDGAVFGPVVTEGIHKPYLFLGEDPSLSATPKAELQGVVRGAATGEAHLLTMSGAGHMNFSDMGVMYRFPPDQLGLIGPIAGVRALTIAAAYLSAFFGSRLRGPSSPHLSDPSPYAEIRVVRGVG
jgi:dienelactone hydrolase